MRKFYTTDAPTPATGGASPSIQKDQKKTDPKQAARPAGRTTGFETSTSVGKGEKSHKEAVAADKTAKK